MVIYAPNAKVCDMKPAPKKRRSTEEVNAAVPDVRAFATFGPKAGDKSVAYLYLICSGEQGMGTVTLLAVEKLAKRMGFKSVHLESLASAKGFYDKQGYVLDPKALKDQLEYPGMARNMVRSLSEKDIRQRVSQAIKKAKKAANESNKAANAYNEASKVADRAEKVYKDMMAKRDRLKKVARAAEVERRSTNRNVERMHKNEEANKKALDEMNRLVAKKIVNS